MPSPPAGKARLEARFGGECNGRLGAEPRGCYVLPERTRQCLSQFVSLYDGEMQLFSLVDRAGHGEEIVIDKNGIGSGDQGFRRRRTMMGGVGFPWIVGAIRALLLG
jgi:hypothetical protein